MPIRMKPSSHFTPFAFIFPSFLILYWLKSPLSLPLCPSSLLLHSVFTICNLPPNVHQKHGDRLFVTGISREKRDKHVHPGWSGVSTVCFFSPEITTLILTMAVCSCFKRLSAPLFMLSSPLNRTHEGKPFYWICIYYFNTIPRDEGLSL